MIQNVRDTSIEHFHEMVATGEFATLVDMAIGYMRARGLPATRRMIATACGRTPSDMTGAIKTLVDGGDLVEVFKAPCDISENMVWWLKIPEVKTVSPVSPVCPPSPGDAEPCGSKAPPVSPVSPQQELF